MKPNPLKDGVLTENTVGIGTVTRQMVRERAVELAAMDGRSAKEMSESDWAQAKRELTGKPDMDPNEASLEFAPESERWDPVAPSEDEDEEGRSDNERLVDEGIAGAEHEQMLQVAKENAKTDKEESSS